MPEAASDHFVDAAIIVDALHAADFEAAIARLERQTVQKLHQAGHGFLSSKVSDIDALNRAGQSLQGEDFFQPRQTFLGIDVEDLGLSVRVQLAALVQRLQHMNFVTEARRPFKLQRRRSLLHRPVHFLQHRLLFPL